MENEPCCETWPNPATRTRKDPPLHRSKHTGMTNEPTDRSKFKGAYRRASSRFRAEERARCNSRREHKSQGGLQVQDNASPSLPRLCNVSRERRVVLLRELLLDGVPHHHPVACHPSLKSRIKSTAARACSKVSARTRVAGNGALDIQQVVLGVNLVHLANNTGDNTPR